MLRERAQPVFDVMGLGATLVLAALVAVWHPDATPPAGPPAQAPPVQLSVVDAPPAPPATPAVEMPPPPPPPPPQTMAPAPLPLPVPLPRRVAHPVRKPVRATPAAPEVSRAEAPAARVSLPPSQGPVRDPTADDAYVGRLHAYLVGRTVPPDDAAYRLSHPHGTADVGFILSRGGAVRGVHIVAGSGSAVLDRQALAIVQGGQYPPMPPQAFAGEADHAFHIPILFRPAGLSE